MGAEEFQLVVFTLKADNSLCEYGTPITQVKEIIRFTTPTRLPKAPAFLEGVINLRGKVISVIDLKKRFDMEINEYTDEARIIVVEIDGQTVGIIVDEVTEVLRLGLNDVEPPPSIMGGITAKYLQGVGKLGERLLVLLDLNKILSESETQALQNIEIKN
ncbi:MAG: chemotaxis protein CheW [Syntrophomonadaceae bacterium]|nr:chemotaxis protein CheW [Syntrophomonadaceae bacterium]